MTDKEKRYWAYFLNVNGKIEYYEQCKKCVRSCKQSFRITKLFCNNIIFIFNNINKYSCIRHCIFSHINY